MRLIVDTNQADAIRRDNRLPKRERQNTTVVLPARVYLELIRGTGAKARLDSLRDFNLRFGLFPADLWYELGGMTFAQIVQYDPLVPSKSKLHRDIKRSLADAPDKLQSTSDEFMQESAEYETKMNCKLRRSMKRFKDAKAKGEALDAWTCKDLNEAYELLFSDEQSPIGKYLISCALNNRRSTLTVGATPAFIKALRLNLHISRFIRVLIATVLAYSDQWDDSNLKGRVSAARGDLTDMTLVLHARNGDVILTADRKITDIINFAIPTGNVRICTWNEWVKTGR